MATKGKKSDSDEGVGDGIGGFLGGLVNLVEKLGELAEKGQELSRSGEFSGSGKEKELKGIYGFNVRFGLGDDKEKVSVEPFGNIKKDKESGRTVVQEIREPLIDVLEEEDYTLVIAEMPGISAKDVVITIHEDVMTIAAEHDEKKYRKELLLPKTYSRDKLKISCNNGIVEIKCVD